MILGEVELDFVTILAYSSILFLVQMFCHYIPKIFGMGKKGEAGLLIVFFGLCLGVAFNMVIPGSLHVVTDAWEEYQNATETEEVLRAFSMIRRLQGRVFDDDDDDDDDDSFRRIIGVAICLGFMLLFLADYIGKMVTKNQREKEIKVALVDGETKPVTTYTNCGLLTLYVSYYVLAALGCMSAYLICDNASQRMFMLVAQLFCMMPTPFLYGMQMKRQTTTGASYFWSALVLSLIVPVCNLLFTWILSLFDGPLLEYLYSLGYPMFCGLVLYICLMYFISLVHIEGSIVSSLVALVCMVAPYFMFRIHTLE